jgi:large subunit ribosomal protein L14e
MSKEIEIGQIVRSKAGRDKGRLMIVVGILDGDHVALCDGDLRKISAPKKKKKKHLAKTNKVMYHIKDRLLSGQKVQNAEIRKALLAYEHGQQKLNGTTQK